MGRYVRTQTHAHSRRETQLDFCTHAHTQTHTCTAQCRRSPNWIPEYSTALETGSYAMGKFHTPFLMHGKVTKDHLGRVCLAEKHMWKLPKSTWSTANGATREAMEGCVKLWYEKRETWPQPYLTGRSHGESRACLVLECALYHVGAVHDSWCYGHRNSSDVGFYDPHFPDKAQKAEVGLLETHNW